MIYGPELLRLRRHLAHAAETALDDMADLNYDQAARRLLMAVRYTQAMLDREQIERLGLTVSEYRTGVTR